MHALSDASSRQSADLPGPAAANPLPCTWPAAPAAPSDPLLREHSFAEPPVSVWRDRATYDGALVHGLLRPLQGAAQAGKASAWLQLAVLRQLHWYFSVDARERAPTVALTTALAPAFHQRVCQLMRYIDAETIGLLDPHVVSTEVRHALLSYKNPVLHTRPQIDAYDHEQGLARLSYFVHGTPPDELFHVDGKAVKPAYAKYRACRYFHRNLLRQRIVWLAVEGASELRATIGGRRTPIALGQQPFSADGVDGFGGESAPGDGALLPGARALFPPGKGGQLPLPSGPAGWKVRLMRAIARTPVVRRRFANAWVLIDREGDADDSAEHLYRWIRENHPEINLWFLLSPSSLDWARLSEEGFKLMPPGTQRRLLILNSEHIISSHTDYVFGGMDRRLYGDAMRWRYTFLQHGVTYNDVSHWLGPREFDRFITSSPAEHASIVGDDTPYPYTEREVQCTGLPRHDRLRRLAQTTPPAGMDTILVMPTWRAGLVVGGPDREGDHRRGEVLERSDYVRQWGGLLRSDALRELAERYSKRLVFMPHANSVPLLDAFRLPPHVRVVGKRDGGMQAWLARSAAFITDYTSVAFDMALLRRAIFYFQFDREAFFSGGHNWRPGYFDYDRDGFGPVAFTRDDLIHTLGEHFARNGQVEARYLDRMMAAMPGRQATACEATFRSIRSSRVAA